jgi:hypothetical protein
VKRGCSWICASTGSARQASRNCRHNSRRAAEQRDARFDLEQQAIRWLDGNLRRERGGDAGQPPHEREFARCIARPRIEMRNERERGSQGHADLHSGRLRIRIRVDDARVAIRSIQDHERRGRSGAPDSAVAMASNGNCGTCAAIHNSRGGSWSAPCESGPLGGGDAGRTRKTDGVALDPGELVAGSGKMSR